MRRDDANRKTGFLPATGNLNLGKNTGTIVYPASAEIGVSKDVRRQASREERFNQLRAFFAGNGWDKNRSPEFDGQAFFDALSTGIDAAFKLRPVKDLASAFEVAMSNEDLWRNFRTRRDSR